MNIRPIKPTIFSVLFQDFFLLLFKVIEKMDLLSKLLLISSMLYVTSGDATSGCDSGWESYNNYCFQFTSVKSITWKQAMTECTMQDASLIRIADQATLTWVTNTMKAKYPSTGYWTGLNDNDKDPTVKLGTGRWKWGFYTPADMTLIQWNSSPANDGISLCAGMTLLSTLSDINCASPSGAICYLPGSGGGCGFGQIGPDDDGGCYYITNTTDTTQLRNWDDAHTQCNTIMPGSDLITVKTANQMNFLKNTLPYQSNTPTIYWVGLKYETTSNQWQWLGGGTPVTNIIQWQVEPDNIAGRENCGLLRMTGRFSDRDCNSNAGYICQKPVYNYTPMDNVGCGPWMRAGKFCYLFSRNSATWTDARNQCLKQNGDLMKVDTLDKRTWLEVQMKDPLFNVYWMGLNDRQTEGTYTWADGTPLNTSLIIWNREPNDYKGDEDCALIYSNGEFNDMACSQHAPAICEISGTSNCPPNGWIANGNSCYMFTAYDKTTSLFTQSEAQSYCVQQNKIANTTGGLLSISSDDEMAFIMQKVKAITDNQYGWWTSLNDKDIEGIWAYADGTNDPKYMSWSNEPSQLPKDDCGMINWGGNYHERDCSWKLAYICERYAFGQSAGSTSKAGVIVIITSLLFFFHETM